MNTFMDGTPELPFGGYRRSGPGSEPDIVIIGSGIGGATMAAGLAASGADVLILEAGNIYRTDRKTAIHAPFSSAVSSARKNSGMRRTERRSIPEIITMSAAIPNSMARC